jgi:PP-loop superfamily ATP-utilizing enzyme
MISIENEAASISGQQASAELSAKFEQVKTILRKLDRVVVAYSGGVDSTLIARIARDLLGPNNVLAVIASSASLGLDEEREALETQAARASLCPIETGKLPTRVTRRTR